MRYQPGRMGAAEAMAIVFILTFYNVFLSTPAITVDMTGNIGWIAPLLSGIYSWVTMWVLLLVLERHNGDLLTVAEKLLGKWGARLVGVYYLLMFVIFAVLSIRQFAENTLMTALPELDFSIATAWYAISAAVLVYYGIEAMARASYIILPFSIFGLLLVLAMLIPEMHFFYLAPWFGTGLDQLFLNSIMGYNAGVIVIALLAGSMQNRQVKSAALWFGLGSSVLMKSLAIGVFIMVFGAKAAAEKTLPFFEMARLIHLSRFIQRLEALFILLWAIVGITSIAISLYFALYLLARLTGLPSIRPVVLVVTLIAAQLAMLPEDISAANYMENWLLKYYYPIGNFVIPLFLGGVSWLKVREKKHA